MSHQKSHFKEGMEHNKNAVKLGCGVLSSLGYLFREKNDKARREAEDKKRARAADKQRKLEEKLKKDKALLNAEGEAEAEGAATEGEEAAAA